MLRLVAGRRPEAGARAPVLGTVLLNDATVLGSEGIIEVLTFDMQRAAPAATICVRSGHGDRLPRATTPKDIR